MLTRTDERFNEGGTRAVKSTATANHYNDSGDIDVRTEYGEAGTADDVVAKISYTSCPATGVRIAEQDPGLPAAAP